jgi:hypothetical protein
MPSRRRRVRPGLGRLSAQKCRQRLNTDPVSTAENWSHSGEGDARIPALTFCAVVDAQRARRRRLGGVATDDVSPNEPPEHDRTVEPNARPSGNDVCASVARHPRPAERALSSTSPAGERRLPRGATPSQHLHASEGLFEDRRPPSSDLPASFRTVIPVLVNQAGNEGER